ncbi:MAG: class II aldolase/adducin family protein [Burkholderiales bacterium]|nr:class II aldolase/adducin family protein [Burkholderiales bacterium]
MSSAPALGASSALVEDLVNANRILADHGIFDAFGHVSARHDGDAGRFVLARNLAPGRVTAADLLEFDVQSGEPLRPDPPRLYLERHIHSEIYKARPDVMAVVHHHSPAVLPFAVARGARLLPVCHMAGFLGGAGHEEGPPLFEIREHAGEASDLLVRNRELGAALARTLGAGRVVLMRGHGATVVAATLRVAVYRAIYAEVNARLLLQAQALGEVQPLSTGEADATRETNEGQVARPWELWCERVAGSPASGRGSLL